MLRHVNDASHWRDRATEMRTIADGYSDKEAAQVMLRLAADYDKLAERAEARSASGLSRLPSVMPKDTRAT